MIAARRRAIRTVIVRKLDRWGRSVVDRVAAVEELGDLGVGFISLTESLDLTTSYFRKSSVSTFFSNVFTAEMRAPVY